MVNCLFSYCHTFKMILIIQDNFQGVAGSEANGTIQVRETTSTKRPLPQIFIHVREACLHQYCFCSSVQKGRGGRCQTHAKEIAANLCNGHLVTSKVFGNKKLT